MNNIDKEFNEIVIFTDGSSRGNPGPGGWGAILILPKQDKKNDELGIKTYEVREIGGREENTTNNRMELTAAIKALEFLFSYKLQTKDYKLIFYTDSNYVINGITKWIYSWEIRNWTTKNKDPVLNKDLWEKLLELSRSKSIEWKYVAGHSGIAGNERADEIATSFADSLNPDLFSGHISEYKIKILDLNGIEKLKKKNDISKSRSRAKAYSYLSLIDGVIKKHKTWAECEKRVKGKSAAKFKKSLSAEEEEEIIKSWKTR